MRSPIVWFGGKGNMTAKLIPLIPEHTTYVEPFGGGASLLFAKEPSPVEVYNDLDSGLVGFFRVLRNPEQFAELHKLASLTPYSREEYNYCRENWAATEDPVTRAYMWYIVARWSFSGFFAASWSSATTLTRGGMAATVSRWLSTVEALPEISARLLRVQVEHKPALDIMRQYDTPNTLFYLDPPYIPGTRKAGKYTHEMTADEHAALVSALLSIQGKALLSGYAHPLYEPLERAGWGRRDFATACYAAGKTRVSGIQGEGSATAKSPRVETVWFNYSLPGTAQALPLFAA